MSFDENANVENVENSESTALPEQESPEQENVETEEQGNEAEEAPKSTPKKKPRYRELQAEIRQMEAKQDEMLEAVQALYNQVDKKSETPTTPAETKPQPEYPQNQNYGQIDRQYQRGAKTFDKEVLALRRSEDAAESEIGRQVQDILADKDSNVMLLSQATIQQCVIDGIEPHELAALEKQMETSNFSYGVPDVEYRSIRKMLKDIRNPKAAPKKAKAPMAPIGKVGGQPKTGPSEKGFDYFMDRFRK